MHRLNGSGNFVLDERVIIQLVEGNLQLPLRVHDDGTVPCHRLADGFPGDEQKAHGCLFR